jgi:hypothetical protein
MAKAFSYMTAMVYEETAWWYRFPGEEAVGPFPSGIEAGSACREEILRRANEQFSEIVST